MPIYLYKGYDAKTGAASKGKIEADSVKQARQLLRAKKIIPDSLKEELKSSSTFTLFQKQTVAATDLAIMTRQFATMQAAHVPLDECLKTLTEQVDNVLLRNTLSSIREGVSEGKSLGDSLARFPNIFNKFYINMVRAGEASGKLGLVLQRLADFIEYQVTIQGKVMSAMAYPIMMILISLGSVLFLFTVVIPDVAKMLKQNNAEIPWFSEMIMVLSNAFINYWYVGIALVALAILMFRIWYRSPEGRNKFDRFCLKAPLMGDIVTRVNISKFTKTLSTLLSSGVPIMMALEITKNIISNTVLAAVVAEAKLAVQEGKSLASVLGRNDYFPPLVSHMIKTGEKTGELETMLEHVADAYDAEVERKINSMISLIEPLMLIFLGVIIGVVILAILMPVLNMVEQFSQ